jgi:hypothetical protein
LIRGNDNDIDGSRFEPHRTEIRSDDQVQVYESVMRDVNGNVTTGLLRWSDEMASGSSQVLASAIASIP